MNNRLLRERKTVETMIKLYCKDNHRAENFPCEECSQLIAYAHHKVENCKFGANKPVCGRCLIHCYNPDMREEIRNVMRTTGAKLALRHPVMTVFHMIDIFRFKPSREFN